MSEVYDLIVIGAGPAGYTAALYASRADLKVLVLEGWQPGGQLTTTTVVENYPGFERGIDGNQLMREMKKQAARFGTEIKSQNVTGVDFSGRPFKIHAGGEEYQSKTVIIATGAKPRKLGIESEERLWSKGVSACATCDGFFFRGKVVAVMGGGDSAMEEAHFLTKFATKVYLIHRREGFRASPIMIDRVKANEKIEILLNKTVEEITGEAHVTGLRLKDTQTGEISELPLDGVFLAIGHIPATELFKNQIELDAMGYVLQTEYTMTSVAGVFAAGDCTDSRYRQAVTSAGSGCRAAIDAERWLEAQE
ncbi:thioredoxin-disulfide reductase [Candidatus Peregrinibacteria bacterium CG_4_10_14_0_2_um_filter_43_11]|nr:MAG: thioredoxin-disulfide reductase [Candidatus Peregrinibacteria bacterium CG_4_10_14_0_2_um_filter_43_11]